MKKLTSPSKRAMAAEASAATPRLEPTGPAGNGPGADAQLRQILDALMALRDGDFTARLPAHWTGVEGKIADVFNDTLTVGGRFAAESKRLSVVVGKEGKLKQRMSVPSATGGWAAMVESHNTLVDDRGWPTIEVTRTIGAVAIRRPCFQVTPRHHTQSSNRLLNHEQQN